MSEHAKSKSAVKQWLGKQQHVSVSITNQQIRNFSSPSPLHLRQDFAELVANYTMFLR